MHTTLKSACVPPIGLCPAKAVLAFLTISAFSSLYLTLLSSLGGFDEVIRLFIVILFVSNSLLCACMYVVHVLMCVYVCVCVEVRG